MKEDIMKSTRLFAIPLTALIVTACASPGNITQIAKQQAKKVAVETAKQEAVKQAANAVTPDETTKDGVKTEGTIVKQSATEVMAPTAKKKKSGMFGIRSEVPEVKMTYGKVKSLANVEKLIVPFYRINYLKSSNYKNESNNSYTKASARVLSTLEGVSDDIFADMTEEAYADFKSKLEAAGYTVKSHEGMASVDKYLAKSKYPSSDDTAYYSVPKSVTYVGGKHSNAEFKVHMAEKTNVMSVDLIADFVINNRNEKKFNLTRAKETVYTSQGANVGGNVAIRVPNRHVAMEIGQPPHSKIAFGTMTDATTGGDKAGDTAKMVAGALFGKGRMTRSTTKRKVVKAEEVKYREAMMDAIRQANTLIVEKLASAKVKKTS